MPIKYQVIGGDGKPVDAHFSVTTQEDDVVIHYKSRGGSKKSGGRINTKYQFGLKLLLEGLGRLGLQIDDILVDTRVTQKMKLSELDRRIRSDAFTYPINLRTCNDFERLRKDICKPQGSIGRTKDAVKGGNQNKQMAIKVGYGTSGCTDANELASLVSRLGIPASGHRKRINLPEKIDREVILRAIDRINADGFAPHHNSHTYDLVHKGKEYPPVAVVAFAYEEISGNPAAPGSIRGGKDTQTFRVLDEAGFTVRPKYHEPTEDEAILEERTNEILQQDDLGPEPPAGNSTPEQRQASSSGSFVRDPKVKAWVLASAAGTCELCRQKAPFIANNGRPYLEVHHVQPLAENGADTPANAVAVCPNCHSRCHHSEDSSEATGQLYEQVKRLEKP